MTTFNADGKSADQLSPPASFDPDPGEVCAPPAPTDAERAEAVAAVKGTATPQLTDTEREADYQAAQSRVDAGLPAQPDDDRKLADRPEPEVVEAEVTGTAIALAERFDIATTGEVWPYDFLEFQGDKLGIRLPTRQALAAFSLASSKYVSLGVKNDLTGLFIARHLSPESYGRVFSRLMDPDDTDYTVDTVGELFNAIVTAAVEADKAAEKADGAK